MLKLYGIGTTLQITLSAHDDQQDKPLLPDLYDARLVTMHGNGMLFIGLELRPIRWLLSTPRSGRSRSCRCNGGVASPARARQSPSLRRWFDSLHPLQC